MQHKTFISADLFCGAGGTSTGMVQAGRRRGIAMDLTAVNHWPVAVATHQANHPWARHVCADLGSVEADPNRLVPGGRLDLLVASPECTHHSVARGGKPCSDQSRSSAFHVLHWLERLDVQELLVENVREFAGWGPLLKRGITWRGKRHAKGRPDPRRKGEQFRSWVGMMQSMGYAVEWRELDAADYGSATNRRRLFIRASKGGRIRWPEATHAETACGGRTKWRAVREVIDWGLPGTSIFGRKTPLKAKTLDRIEAGLRKFGGEPFIAILRGTNASQSGAWAKGIDEPLGTVSAGGVHAALCQPFVVPMEHGGRSALRPVDGPLPTITTAKGGAFGLCQPFVVEYHSPKRDGDQRVRDIADPLPTATTENRFGLCVPFVMNVAHAGGERVSSCDKPLGTIPAGHRGEFALCQPFVTKYYGSGDGAKPVTEPLATVTAKDRFGLCVPQGMDILFRMFQPHELAAAMGFASYHFEGTKTDQVRQIGNAVSVDMAEALCGSVMDAWAGARS